MEKQPLNIHNLTPWEICEYLRVDRSIYVPCIIAKHEIEERLEKILENEDFDDLCEDFDNVFEEVIKENILDEIDDHYGEEK